jgi:hypothetical protein
VNDDVAPRGGRRPASRAATSSVKSVLYSMGTENVQPGDPVSQGKRSVHSNSQREAPFAMDADMAFNPPDKPPAYGQQRVKVGADNITNKKFDPDVYSANCAAAKDVSMQGRERNRIGGGNILSFEPDN